MRNDRTIDRKYYDAIYLYCYNNSPASMINLTRCETGVKVPVSSCPSLCAALVPAHTYVDLCTIHIYRATI